MAQKKDDGPAVPKVWESVGDIDRGISKLQRRLGELQKFDIQRAEQEEGRIGVVVSDLRETIRSVFGEYSPEFKEHGSITMWSGYLAVNLSHHEKLARRQQGLQRMVNVTKGLIARLEEVKLDLADSPLERGATSLDAMNLHPRIFEVASELFNDGHHWEAVFAASKALNNYVKEKSGESLDGTKLMYAVFSRQNPILAVSSLTDQVDQDEQEGMMHMFVGVSLGIRNPGGHSFPEGPQQRAVEYLSLISMLAYRVQEARKVRRAPPQTPAG